MAVFPVFLSMKAEVQIDQRKKTFVFLWLLSLIGSWAVLPYARYLAIVPSSTSIWTLLVLGTLQSALFFGLICWLSAKILPKTDLQPFGIEHPLKTILYPSLISGTLLGLTIFLLDKAVFRNSLLLDFHPPLWAGALASLYGGLNEEILLRLFLLTLIYFVLRKSFKIDSSRRSYALWTANILVAIIFGLGHLPAALKIAPLSFFEVSRVLILNGLGGIVFGWLYWSRGLWTAMGAHVVTDLVIYGLSK